MATKRGEKTRLIELEERERPGGRSRFGSNTGNQSPFKRPNEFIERLVLPTDTLQGLALLYNTSVAEIKKLNSLYTDTDLHARRVIKVPARGILINLEEVPSPPCLQPALPSAHHVQSILNSDEEESEENNVQEYLNGKDNLLKVIQDKANHAASSSPILNSSADGDISEEPTIRKGIYNAVVDRKKESSLKWWHIFFPCLGFVFIFPILLYVFQEHVHELEHDNSTLKESKIAGEGEPRFSAFANKRAQG